MTLKSGSALTIPFHNSNDCPNCGEIGVTSIMTEPPSHNHPCPVPFSFTVTLGACKSATPTVIAFEDNEVHPETSSAFTEYDKLEVE